MHHSITSPTASGRSVDDKCLPGGAPQRPRVLFVNADSDLRKVVTRVLERANYDVRAVDHSGHAVLLSRSAEFDVLVTELSGPDVSGPVLLERLRRHSPMLVPLYLANPGTPDGINHVLVRPFTREDLLIGLELALSSVHA